MELLVAINFFNENMFIIQIQLIFPTPLLSKKWQKKLAFAFKKKNQETLNKQFEKS